MPKMDYFSSKSPKIAKCWGLRPPDSLVPGDWGLHSQIPVQVKLLKDVQDPTPTEITG